MIERDLKVFADRAWPIVAPAGRGRDGAQARAGAADSLCRRPGFEVFAHI